jgi:hypothetical protein
VQIMARIYAYALSVSVWLGEEENGSSSVMDMCRSVVAEGLSYSNEWRLTGSKHLERAEGALMLFVSRPWFRRVWVGFPSRLVRFARCTKRCAGCPRSSCRQGSVSPMRRC